MATLVAEKVDEKCLFELRRVFFLYSVTLAQACKHPKQLHFSLKRPDLTSDRENNLFSEIPTCSNSFAVLKSFQKGCS